MALPRILLSWCLVLLGAACGSDTAPPAEIQAATETVTTAATGKPAFLWKVASSGAKDAYLFGTMHAGDPRFLEFNPEVQRALDAVDAVYTELEMDKKDDLASSLAGSVQLPAGKTLSDFVEKEVLDGLDILLGDFGMSTAMLQSMRPVMVSMILQLMPLQERYGDAEALDVVLYAQAKEAGKEVGGIEVIEEQLVVFNALTDEESGQALKKVVDMLLQDKEEGRDRIGEMVEHYLSGSEERLLGTLLEKYDPEDPLDAKAMEAILYVRNAHMADRIAQKIRANPEKSYFFAFGALHFLGERSVVTKLQDAGLKVTRLSLPG